MLDTCSRFPLLTSEIKKVLFDVMWKLGERHLNIRYINYSPKSGDPEFGLGQVANPEKGSKKLKCFYPPAGAHFTKNSTRVANYPLTH